MSYTLRILRSAQKQLQGVGAEDRNRIIETIYELADGPRPPASKKPVGRPAWRIRTGDYRILYEIHDDEVLLPVVAVGHRRDVYRK